MKTLDFYAAIDLFQEVVGLEDPFADKIVVILGDFRQLLPPVSKASSGKTRRFVKDDFLTAMFETLELPLEAAKNGASDDEDFVRYLKTIGGYLHDSNERKLPPDCLCDDETQLVDFVYAPFETKKELEQSAQNVLLTISPTTEAAYNERYLKRCEAFGSKTQTFELANRREFTGELSDGWSEKSSHHAPLRLAEGAIIRLIDNVDINAGLYTGKRLLLDEIRDDETLVCRRINGAAASPIDVLDLVPVEIKRKTLFYQIRDAATKCYECFDQFPVELAFALRIFKARGQRFGRVGVYLNEATDEELDFSGGLYTALSAVRAFDRLKVLKSSGVAAIKRKRLSSSIENGATTNGASPTKA